MSTDKTLTFVDFKLANDCMYVRYGSLGESTNENPKKQSNTISKSLKKLWKASFVVSTLEFSSKNMSSENFGTSVSI